LVRGPHSDFVTAEVMQAACDLMRWQGRETTRIYSFLVETPEQREDRQLTQWVEQRGHETTVREAMQNCWALRGKTSDEITRSFDRLVKAGRGRWVDRKGQRGPVAHVFQILLASTSTGFGNLRGKIEKPVGVDARNIQEIEPASASAQEDLPAPSGEMHL